MQQFREHYGPGSPQIEKTDVFAYVYAVLHDPAYRDKYALNLKRELPRVPLYVNFWKWAGWGQKLVELHLDYDAAPPFPLKRRDSTPSKGGTEKPRLKADKDKGVIVLDQITTLTGVPPAAWEYKLGKRSALDWILEQYKESVPLDTTIASKFNTYRFSDYREQVIDLLARVTTVNW